MNGTRFFRIIFSRLTGRRLDWLLAGFALLLAILPARALAPWTGDVARIVVVPIVPLMHLGMVVRDRIRPPRAAFDARAPEVVELELATERYRTLFEQSRLKAEALDREIAQLKAVRTRLGNSGVQLETASVVGIDPTRREGLVRINAGLRQGVHRDAAVIIHGDILGGIVANDPGEFVSLVKPAQRCSLSVRLYPADGVDAGLNPSAYPGTVLKPIDGGLWIGDIASDVEIREGQIARVTDDRFGSVARGMRVGRVRRILPNEQVPLARRVEVEPLAQLIDESTVVVAIDPPEARP
ncbi:MAG: hypothetical protein DWI09_04500 [Planctomycetota bacterium]|jgi:hypothetical protein|nr:MAG: hypothetical protein DWI09_04500 [Planctomycetota bacterium]